MASYTFKAALICKHGRQRHRMDARVVETRIPLDDVTVEASSKAVALKRARRGHNWLREHYRKKGFTSCRLVLK